MKFLKQLEHQVRNNTLESLDITKVTVSWLTRYSSPIVKLTKLNNDLILTAHADHAIKIWDINTQLCLDTFQATSSVKALSLYSLNSRNLAAIYETSNGQNELVLISYANGKEMARAVSDKISIYYNNNNILVQRKRSGEKLVPYGSTPDCQKTPYNTWVTVLNSDGEKICDFEHSGSSFKDDRETLEKSHHIYTASKDNLILMRTSKKSFYGDYVGIREYGSFRECDRTEYSKTLILGNTNIEFDKHILYNHSSNDHSNRFVGVETANTSNDNIIVFVSYLSTGQASLKDAHFLKIYTREGRILCDSETPKCLEYHPRYGVRKGTTIAYLRDPEIISLPQNHTAIVYRYECKTDRNDRYQTSQFEIYGDDGKKVLSQETRNQTDGYMPIITYCLQHSLINRLQPVEIIKNELIYPRALSTVSAVLDDQRSVEFNGDTLILHDPTVAAKLRYSDVIPLISLLEHNTSITACNFSGVDFGDEGVKKLTNTLRHNNTVTTLILNGNNITDIGVKLLLTLLQTNRNIVAIRMAHNSISEDLATQVNWWCAKNQRRQQEIAAVDNEAPVHQTPIIGGDGLNVSHDFYCPISDLIMFDPVIAADGESYEREEIVKWLEKSNTSPKTQAPLEHKQLIPNKNLKRAITEFLDSNPELKTSHEVYFPNAIKLQCQNAVRSNNGNELRRLLTLEKRLLTHDFDVGRGATKRLLEIAAENGGPEVIEAILHILTPLGLRRQVIALGDDGAIFFKAAASQEKEENAAIIANALGWGVANYLEQMFIAINNYDVATVKTCLALEAPLNTVNEMGDPPLHAAVLANDRALFNLFLDRGANVYSRNNSQLTVFEYAEQLGRNEMLACIKNAENRELVHPYQEQIRELTRQVRELQERLARFELVSDDQNARAEANEQREGFFRSGTDNGKESQHRELDVSSWKPSKKNH